VLEVLFDEQTAVGVRIKHADGTTRDVACRVVVDATGQQSLLANRLGLREENPKMRKASIWTYFRGALRDSGLDEGATVILHTIDKRSWFWWIPLPNDVVSVGLVADADFLLKGRGKPGDTFQEELLRCAALNKRLAGAQRIEDFRTVRDFSYVSTRPAGEGWVLIGDAFGFLDPVYSSGVFLALKSGEMAADAIIDGLPRDDVSPAQLGRWADEFKQGMRLIGKLVDAFYTERFSFGRFMKEYPHHRGRLTDLLVGKVFKPGVSEIFDDMEPWLVEARKAIAEDDASKMTG
jgi:flavin-dependent dehydrogenase